MKIRDMKKQIEKVQPGLVVSGQGMGGGQIEGPIEIMFAGVVGALIGFVFGLLLGSLARIFTLNRVKGMIGGRHWAAYGAGAGALALAMVELLT